MVRVYVGGLEIEVNHDNIKQGNDRTLEDKSKAKETKSEPQRKLINGGEFMKNHPWNDRPKIMPDEMAVSSVYTVGKAWKHSDKVDLGKVYLHLPKFVMEMKDNTCREELEEVLQNCESSPKMLWIKPTSEESLTPHVKEIVDKQRKKPGKEKERFRAYSLPPPQLNPNIWFLDCEYMCKVHLPGNTSDWFDVSNSTGKRIRGAKLDKIDQRWIFTPSFRRAKIVLLDWPDDADQILNPENTIRILEVRPTEFEEYVKYCGDKFHIISLPNDEIVAGYPRLWVQKIALRLKLNFIWMVDDSVERFYEYHPDDGEETIYTPDRQRKFRIVFRSIEYFVQSAKSHADPIAAMSPRRSRDVKPPLTESIVRLPPQIAVYLKLEALKSRDIYYRPELQTLEDMIFAYECEKGALKFSWTIVYTWRIRIGMTLEPEVALYNRK
ncbi:hypothetical protein AWC38_SpisGene11397 [Stylophora pistillata]|uniref:TET-Associated Glycosyltransferase domain-containing protein n=1 Tax=Stylophora pistillata TaxID=50429 RepID=A0A2B4S3R0_STYPI|nr:hypothetical protein AWC38_SpisGene11397 [Stylophora pistillata]